MVADVKPTVAAEVAIVTTARIGISSPPFTNFMYAQHSATLG